MNSLKMMIRRNVAIVLAVVMSLSVINLGTGFKVSAAVTPSFGSFQSKQILYVNDPNLDYRIVNIPIKNWQNGYAYKAWSENKAVVKVENASVNSKTGITLRAQSKGVGKTSIKIEMCKNGKTIKTTYVKVEVYARPIATPTSLKFLSRTTNSVKISYVLNNRAYATGYYIQLSSSPKFTTIDKAYKTTSVNVTSPVLTGLSRGKQYFCRVAAISTRNGYNVFSNWSSVIGVYTNLR